MSIGVSIQENEVALLVTTSTNVAIISVFNGKEMMKTNKNSNKDNPTNRLFKKPLSPELGPIETYTKAEKIPSQCPNPDCSSNNIRQKGKERKGKERKGKERKGKEPNRRTFLHSENGTLKRVILLRHRCECRDCKTTFYHYIVRFATILFSQQRFRQKRTKKICRYLLTSHKYIIKETPLLDASDSLF